jgi:hypothetical protein
MFDSSIAGLRHGLAMAEQAAGRIARSESADPADQVDLMLAKRVVEANVVALRTSLSMTDHLVDIFA